MIRSIRLRLILVGGCLLLAFVILSGIAINSALQRYTQQAEFQRLQGIVYGLLAAVDVDIGGQIQLDSTALPESRLSQSDSGLLAYIANAEGIIDWRSLSSPDDSAMPKLRSAIGEWNFAAEPAPLMAFGFEWLGSGATPYVFTMIVEDRGSPLYAQQSLFKKRLWWGLGLTALILLLTLLGLLFWGLRPLRQVVAQLESIRLGQRTQIEHNVPTEIQPLTDSINTLLNQERHRQTRYRNAMADLAHSLKTPLAVLKSRQTQPRQAAETDPIDPIDRIDQIINYQLQRASLPAPSTLHPPLGLAPGLQRTIDALKKVHVDRALTFHSTIDEALEYPIDEGDWMELCGNLLDNASKHAQQHIIVSLDATNDPINLTIADDGPGFPDHPETLLQRGKRADSLAPGQGIGLAVVSDICTGYGFDLTLINGPNGGAKVSVILTRPDGSFTLTRQSG